MLHLGGDVAIGGISMLVLLYFWLPLRALLINDYIKAARVSLG